MIVIDSKLEEKLMHDFPFMESKDIHDKPTGRPIHCECSDGWFQLIWDLCEELTELYKLNNITLRNIHVHQVKEKYGSLRFYTGWVIREAHDIIDKYEALSEVTCEICGDDGELVGDRWVKALCGKCHKEVIIC